MYAHRILVVLPNDALGDLEDVAKYLSMDLGDSHPEVPEAVSLKDDEHLHGLIIGALRKLGDFTGLAVRNPSGISKTAVEVFDIDDRNRRIGVRSRDPDKPERRVIKPRLRGLDDQAA